MTASMPDNIAASKTYSNLASQHHPIWQSPADSLQTPPQPTYTLKLWYIGQPPQQMLSLAHIYVAFIKTPTLPMPYPSSGISINSCHLGLFRATSCHLVRSYAQVNLAVGVLTSQLAVCSTFLGANPNRRLVTLHHISVPYPVMPSRRHISHRGLWVL